jgi:hypothetical protein
MAIDLSTVNWIYVALMAFFVFVAALLGSVISFRNRVGGAVIAAILFAVAFVYWTYYPHPGLPGPISVGSIVPASSSGPAPSTGPSSAAAPANPVSTISQAPAAAPTAPPASDAK